MNDCRQRHGRDDIELGVSTDTAAADRPSRCDPDGRNRTDSSAVVSRVPADGSQETSVRSNGGLRRRAFRRQDSRASSHGTDFSYGKPRAATQRQRILRLAGVSRAEARSVAVLRWSVLVVWIAAACVISLVFVKRYAQQAEYDEFQFQFRTNAQRILANVFANIDSKLTAIGTLSNTIVRHAKQTDSKFPFVTVPDFVVAGSDTRILADSSIIHWLPLVWEENRTQWERYAYENRFQATREFQQENYLRIKQDMRLGYLSQEQGTAQLAEYDGYQNRVYHNPPLETVPQFSNILLDGTNYHPRIWSLAVGHQPLKDGSGPYFPIWQRTPMNSLQQASINNDLSQIEEFRGPFQHYVNQYSSGLGSSLRRVVLSPAIINDEGYNGTLSENILRSQYRHRGELYVDDPVTRIIYPVHDGYDVEEAPIVGVLSSAIYWRLMFTDLLPSNAKGYICTVRNTLGQVFSYRIDGHDVTYIGEGDPIDRFGSDYVLRDMAVSLVDRDGRFSNGIMQRPDVETRSYTTLAVDVSYSSYDVSIYPTQDTLEVFQTDEPWFYTSVVASIFVLAAIVFLAYDFCVQRRQQLVASKAIENATKAAVAERDLNEYIAHEVRNPLSAALSACGFVSSEVNRSEPLADEQSRQVVREDVQIIDSSLSFVNELLRNLLDLHRATDRQIRIRKRETDVFEDVLKPVASILYRRDDVYRLVVECSPRRLRVMSDCLRLKQVLLNLGRNASKYVSSGFLRLRAEVVDVADAACDGSSSSRMGGDGSNNSSSRMMGGGGGGSNDGSGGRSQESRSHGGVGRDRTGDRAGDKTGDNTGDNTGDEQRSRRQSVRLYVEDSGPGIPVENRQHLFSKFRESLDVQYQGSGIGLCLCKNLLDIMGGDIWLDESYDSGVDGQPGARFVIDLNMPPLPESSNIHSGGKLTDGTCKSIEPDLWGIGSNCIDASIAIGSDDVGAHGAVSPDVDAICKVTVEATLENRRSCSVIVSPSMAHDVLSKLDEANSDRDNDDDENRLSKLVHPDFIPNDKPRIHDANAVSRISNNTIDGSTKRDTSNGEEPYHAGNKEPATHTIDATLSGTDKPSLEGDGDAAHDCNSINKRLKSLAETATIGNQPNNSDDISPNAEPRTGGECVAKTPPHPTVSVFDTATSSGGGRSIGISSNTVPQPPDNMSVLFVDDDKVLRKLFGRCIKRALPTWTVQEAPDGETALDMVDASDSFDVIFMDQYMSTTEKKLLGTETVSILRERGVASKICGLSANDIGDEFVSAGADGFICKPLSFDKDELREEMSKILSA